MIIKEKEYFCDKETNAMSVSLGEKDLKKLIVIGDKVLIKPKSPTTRTQSGLYLPSTVTDVEKVVLGYVVKVGPGTPIPALNDEGESWKATSEQTKYIPLQPKEGDQAVYLQNQGVEIEFNDVNYVIVPQSAILLLLRDDGLFD